MLANCLYEYHDSFQIKIYIKQLTYESFGLLCCIVIEKINILEIVRFPEFELEIIAICKVTASKTSFYFI